MELLGFFILFILGERVSELKLDQHFHGNDKDNRHTHTHTPVFVQDDG